VTNLVDVSLVNDEVHLAEFRVRYYSGIVSTHYFFEASHTHSGRPKESHLAKSEFLSSTSSVKLISLDIPQCVLDKKDRWAIEEYSRDWAMNFVAQVEARSIMILSDIDEFPSKEQLGEARRIAQSGYRAIPPLRTSYRYVNWVDEERWSSVRVFRADRAKPGIRFMPGKMVRGEMGAHLRYLGYDRERIASKHQAFAHEELDAPRFSSPEFMTWCDTLVLSHIPRFDRGESGALVWLDKEELGEVESSFLRENPDVFSHHSSLYSRLRRQVAYYWICRWVKRETHRSLDELMNSVLSGWGFTYFRGLYWVVVQRTRLPQAVRVMRRAIEFLTSSRVRGRSLVHHLRGVYRFGDQLSLSQETMGKEKRRAESF
jgi:hypothetical protein